MRYWTIASGRPGSAPIEHGPGTSAAAHFHIERQKRLTRKAAIDGPLMERAVEEFNKLDATASAPSLARWATRKGRGQ